MALDLATEKANRVRDINRVLDGEIKLSDEVKAVCRHYGKDPDKFFAAQVLALRRFNPEQVASIMRMLTDKNFLAPQPTSQEVFLNTEADIVLYGGAAGSGKTHALLMDALAHIDDPEFNAVYFRQNNTQLEGGLWIQAKKFFGMFGGVPTEQNKTIKFPSGARIKFAYMELDKHKDGHQGIEYSAIYWDEFTHFTWSQVSYLMSRMRSAAESDSYMKCSMNPDKTHFVYDWVKPFLDEHGFPDPEMCGRIRYYVLQEGVLVGDWDRDALQREFPLEIPQTYTFISGTIDDNPILDFIEPKYRGKLENNTPVNVARLRYGNWDAMPEGSNYFQRSWVQIVDKVPANATRVRSWDIAATLPSELNPNPDWTAGVRMSKDADGIYYVEDVVRFRDRPAGVKAQMLATAYKDENTTLITVPQDPKNY